MKRAILHSFFSFVTALLIASQVTYGALAQTASLLPWGVIQFFDNNGNPLSGGKVYNYIPSTTTFKTTWQDSGEAVANTNPITLDAAGRAIIYGQGTYRQIVKDRNGNTIWDAVTSSVGSGGSSASTGDGDLVGTVKPWAGITAPNQYAFAYGQELSRTTYSVLYTAITLTTNVICTSSSNTLTGITDTTTIPVGAAIELTCVIPGTTVVSKTSSTVVMSNSSSITLNTTGTFFPFGNGNGSTTFNMPDLRDMVIAGRPNMGGTDRGLITSTYFGVNPAAQGALGGSQSTTLAQANLPNIVPIFTGTILGTHTHTTAGVVSTVNAPANTSTAGGATWRSGDTLTSSAVSAGTPAGTISSINGNVTQTAFSRIQPTITFSYIIKVTPDTNSSIASGVTSLGGMTGDIACGTGLSCTGNIINVSAVACSLFTSILPGCVPPSGGGTVNFLRADGNWVAVTGATFANPTASVGLTAVNGSATTSMRSDGAPPLSASIQTSLTGTNHAVLLGTGAFGVNSLAACTTGYFVGGNGGSADPSCQGYVSTGSSPTTRTWNAKANDIVSILDFGADPTGSVNAQSAIQNAVNSVTTGGIVLVPGKGYSISSGSITINKPLTFICTNYSDSGGGNINFSQGTGPGIVINSSYVQISGCYFNRAGTPQATDYGIVVGNDSNATATDAVCTNGSPTVTSAGNHFASAVVGMRIKLPSCASGATTLFASITAASAGSITISPAAGATPGAGVSAVYGNVYIENVIRDVWTVNHKIGLYWIDAAQQHADHLYSNSVVGMQVENPLNPDYGDSFVSNSTLLSTDNTNGYSMEILSSGGLKISNTKFLYGKYNLYVNWNLGNSANPIITGSSLESSGTAAVFISPNQALSRVSFTGNSFSGNVQVDNTSTSVITDFVFSGNTLNGTMTIGKVTNAVISGNTIDNGGSGTCVTIQSGATNVRTATNQYSCSTNISNSGSGSVIAVPMTEGGSGLTSVTNHGVVLGGASTFGQVSVGATGTVLRGQTGADPAFGAVALTTDVTGILPIANGGTNNSTAYTSGSIVFSDGTKLTQANTNLYWDSSNNRICVNIGAGCNFAMSTVGVAQWGASLAGAGIRYQYGAGTTSGTAILGINYNNSALNQIALSGTGNDDLSVSTTGDVTVRTTMFITTLATDATHTDRTVCQDTTSKGLFFGSGTAGICLGTSGRQFKTEFAPMTAGLSELMQLPLYNYKYKNGYGDDGARLQYGLVAQDVVSVMPELVGRSVDGEIINYDWGAMVFISIRAIQELKTNNDNLKNRLDQLERRIGAR